MSGSPKAASLVGAGLFSAMSVSLLNTCWRCCDTQPTISEESKMNKTVRIMTKLVTTLCKGMIFEAAQV